MDIPEQFAPSFTRRMSSDFAALSIRIKLALVIALGFILAFVASFALLVSSQGDVLDKVVAKADTLAASRLASDMAGPLQFSDEKRILNLYAAALEGDNAITHIDVQRSSGDFLSSHGPDDANRTSLRELIDSVRQSGEPATFRAGDQFNAAVPVFASDKSTILGVLGMQWDHSAASQEMLIDTLIALGVSASVAGGMLCAIVFLISRLVTNPLASLNQAMTAISGRAYDTEIPGSERRDEIGEMSKTLQTLSDKLGTEEEQAQIRTEEAALRQRFFIRLGEVLSELADGRTDGRIDAAQFDGLDKDSLEICSNFNHVLENLQEMLGTIMTTAESVRTSAFEISETAEDQSRRSESQAATLEESAAAIEELNTSVQQTASHAADANKRILLNKKQAEEGGEVVGKTVEAMRNIEHSSQQITAIIGVIDDIAFQTNLLALNAGVEAARAGDAGRGFAVVASEVRALAQRASDSAHEIKELITRSTEQVTQGSELASEAGVALSDIIDGVKHISDLVSLIATGSQEQATNLAEIKESVSDLDQVTQQNAAVIEESSAASRSLSKEAERMSEALGRFKIEGGQKDQVTVVKKAEGRRGPVDKGWASEVDELENNGNPKMVDRPAKGKIAVNDKDRWHDF